MEPPGRLGARARRAGRGRGRPDEPCQRSRLRARRPARIVLLGDPQQLDQPTRGASAGRRAERARPPARRSGGARAGPGDHRAARGPVPRPDVAAPPGDLRLHVDRLLRGPAPPGRGTGEPGRHGRRRALPATGHAARRRWTTRATTRRPPRRRRAIVRARARGARDADADWRDMEGEQRLLVAPGRHRSWRRTTTTWPRSSARWLRPGSPAWRWGRWTSSRARSARSASTRWAPRRRSSRRAASSSSTRATGSTWRRHGRGRWRRSCARRRCCGSPATRPRQMRLANGLCLAVEAAERTHGPVPGGDIVGGVTRSCRAAAAGPDPCRPRRRAPARPRDPRDRRRPRAAPGTSPRSPWPRSSRRTCSARRRSLAPRARPWSSGAAVGAVLLSALMAQRGRRPGLALGYAIGVGGALLATLAVLTRSFPLLLLGTLFIGFGNSSNQLSRYASADMAPARQACVRHRPRRLGIDRRLGHRAPGSCRSRARWRWRRACRCSPGPYLVPVLFVGTAAVATFVFLRPDPYELADDGLVVAREDPASRAIRSARSCAGPASARRSSALIAGQFVMTLIMTMTPLHMTQHGHDLGAVGLVLSGHTLGMFALSPVSGRLTERFGSVPDDPGRVRGARRVGGDGGRRPAGRRRCSCWWPCSCWATAGTSGSSPAPRCSPSASSSTSAPGSRASPTRSSGRRRRRPAWAPGIVMAVAGYTALAILAHGRRRGHGRGHAPGTGEQPDVTSSTARAPTPGPRSCDLTGTDGACQADGRACSDQRPPAAIRPLARRPPRRRAPGRRPRPRRAARARPPRARSGHRPGRR